MRIDRYPRGAVIQFLFELIASGVGATGQAPVFAIGRGDGKWWNGTSGLFQAGYVENAMTAASAAHLPGMYTGTFDHSKDELDSNALFLKLANAGTPAALEYRELDFGAMASTTGAALCSVQGTVLGLGGKPMPGAEVLATLVPVLKDNLGRGYSADAPIRSYTASDGSFDVPLVRGALVRLEIPSICYDRRITVPDQSQALFTDL